MNVTEPLKHRIADMNIIIKNIPEEQIISDVLILPFFEDQFIELYDSIDKFVGGLISAVCRSGDFTGKLGQVMLLPARQINSSRLLFAGLGKLDEITQERIRQAGSKAFSALRDLGVADIALSTKVLNLTAPGNKFAQKPAFYFIEGGLLGMHRFERYKTGLKSKKGGKAKQNVSTISVIDADKLFNGVWLLNVTAATCLARDLINTPANDLTPSAFAELAKSTGSNQIKVKVLERKEIEKIGMGAYLAVTKGSDQPPKFVIMEYEGKKEKSLVLIGKSVTFDSGGLDIKPGEGMERMKYDMAGGAVVLAVMKTISEMRLPVKVTAILPAVENLIGGSATRPGDVVKTLSGKTVEIISTDAEGRLTLADAVGYAIKYIKPRAIIDIATLTGACSMAFGGEAIAMMGTDSELMSHLRVVSEEVHERVWPMPLFDEYGEYLKSDIADIKNVGGRKGALSSSAYFLKEFTGDTPWIHLDIAGAAWSDKDRPYSAKGATGVGVRLLLNLIKEISQ
ncbi:MAG TPA: leucyl aminopeptidase [Dissulfurispiraceae bacterium]|nr:leucyl aminopeptidase [Dissulfurispiraceae bacterium]